MSACECGCGAETTVYKGQSRRFIRGHAMRCHLGAVKQGLSAWKLTPDGSRRWKEIVEDKRAMMSDPAHQAKLGKGKMGREIAHVPATTKPSARDIAWSAGFLEGEGSFFAQGDKYAQVSATQVQREPLDRLAAMFGGKVWERPSRKLGWQPTHWWRVSGSRARGVGMTIFVFMSPRRKGQILTMLGA